MEKPFLAKVFLQCVSYPTCYTKSRFCDALLYFVLQKMCEACMLHSRVVVQALRWVVEIATQEK